MHRLGCGFVCVCVSLSLSLLHDMGAHFVREFFLFHGMGPILFVNSCYSISWAPILLLFHGMVAWAPMGVKFVREFSLFHCMDAYF